MKKLSTQSIKSISKSRFHRRSRLVNSTTTCSPSPTTTLCSACTPGCHFPCGTQNRTPRLYTPFGNSIFTSLPRIKPTGLPPMSTHSGMRIGIKPLCRCRSVMNDMGILKSTRQRVNRSTSFLSDRSEKSDKSDGTKTPPSCQATLSKPKPSS